VRRKVVEVIIQDNPLCPHCEALRKSLLPVLKRLDVVVDEHVIGGHSLSAFEEDYASATYKPEWIEAFGSNEMKKKLKELSPILNYLGGAVSFPVIKVRWYDGVAPREVVIKGFPTDVDSPDVKEFVRNFASFIQMVKKVEEESQ
jgi:thiol-disulfide isomerase/thioredoxin